MVAAKSKPMLITALLSQDSRDYTYRIKFSNVIMVNKGINKCDQRLRYTLEQWNKIGSFDVLNNISEHVILVQLMD